LERFKNFGLNFQVDLERKNLTTPKDFNNLFPATDGSLYGQSPDGMMATFQRPKCVTSIANLFLVAEEYILERSSDGDAIRTARGRGDETSRILI